LIPWRSGWEGCTNLYKTYDRIWPSACAYQRLSSKPAATDQDLKPVPSCSKMLWVLFGRRSISAIIISNARDFAMQVVRKAIFWFNTLPLRRNSGDVFDLAR
jgi:hypothetical protein